MGISGGYNVEPSRFLQPSNHEERKKYTKTLRPYERGRKGCGGSKEVNVTLDFWVYCVTCKLVHESDFSISS